jgi:carotenoid cleavage dioxygenase-like enzyme
LFSGIFPDRGTAIFASIFSKTCVQCNTTYNIWYRQQVFGEELKFVPKQQSRPEGDQDGWLEGDILPIGIGYSTGTHASVGHTSAQAPQSVQRAGSIT